MTEDVKKIDSQKRDIGVYKVMGLFFGVFGIAVIIAIIFTETTRGKVVNLICGGLLLLAALVAIIRPRVNKSKEE